MLQVLLTSLDTEEERKTLTTIYNEHKYALFATAYKICCDQSIAEDAVHNAFEQLIKKHKKDMALPPMDFRRRYLIVVKNKTIDLMRREKIYSDQGMENLEYKFADGDAPPDVRIINEEEYADLRKNIEKLDELSKLVLEMKYVLNMSYKKIGAELGLSPEHVSTRIARAKAKVRKAMERKVREYD